MRIRRARKSAAPPCTTSNRERRRPASQCLVAAQGHLIVRSADFLCADVAGEDRRAIRCDRHIRPPIALISSSPQIFQARDLFNLSIGKPNKRETYQPFGALTRRARLCQPSIRNHSSSVCRCTSGYARRKAGISARYPVLLNHRNIS